MTTTIEMTDPILRRASDGRLKLPRIEVKSDGSERVSLASFDIGVTSVGVSLPEVDRLSELIARGYRESAGRLLRGPVSSSHLIEGFAEWPQRIPPTVVLRCIVELLAEDPNAKGRSSRQTPPTLTRSQFEIRGEDIPAPSIVETREGVSFPGVVVVDFGNSSSSVVILDEMANVSTVGLAGEQDLRLRQLFLKHILPVGCGCPCRDGDPELTDSWMTVLKQTLADLERVLPESVGDDVCNRLRERASQSGESFFHLVRRLEINLRGQDKLRRELLAMLHQIRRAAFSEPQLLSQGILPIPLDIEARPTIDALEFGQFDILSELEITGLGRPLQSVMGKKARADRLRSEGSINDARFQPSPKRYLIDENASLDVNLRNQHETIRGHQVLQSALAHLLGKADEVRKVVDQLRARPGPFKRAIVTYPTASAPSVRRQLEKYVEELGYTEVGTDYDEAVAAAIFYLFRDFGGRVDLAPDLFKARSKYKDGKWYQNVLVLDIGGGSTDIALLKIALTEEDVFEAGEERGLGGHSYVLRPRVLGSSGNTHLGGDLISLRVFETLKKVLCDKLLTALQERKLDCQGLIVGDLLQPAFFVSGTGNGSSAGPSRYRPGSLLEADNHRSALDDAEKILPTRGLDNPKNLGLFYRLWDLSEELKIKLGSVGESGDNSLASTTLEVSGDSRRGHSTFVLDQKTIEEILKMSKYEFKFTETAPDLSISFTREQFETIARPIIETAVKIVQNLIDSRLKDAYSKENEEAQRLDWLILSGRTCNLSLVPRLLSQAFKKSALFNWNEDRVTFDPRYAKLATAAGAAIAEMLQRFSFNREGLRKVLKKGDNQLTIKVDNLFFNLPCSFWMRTNAGYRRIFSPEERLFRLDADEEGKARSVPTGLQGSIAVQRLDYGNPEQRRAEDGAKPIPWISFDSNELARSIGESFDETRDYLQVQFEVNQKLEMRLFLWDNSNGGPHYLVSPESPQAPTSLNIYERMKQRKESLAAVSTPGQSDSRDSETVDSTRLPWSVAVDVQIARGMGRPPTVIWKANEEFKEFFHTVDPTAPQSDKVCRGLIARDVALFEVKNDSLPIYVQLPDQDHWVPIGDLKRPAFPRVGHSHKTHKSDFPRQYHLTIDDRGEIRIHVGEVPYWSTEDTAVWWKYPGCVLIRTPMLQSPITNDELNPFNGMH